MPMQYVSSRGSRTLRGMVEILVGLLSLTAAAWGQSARGDFDNDGFADLAIGVSEEPVGNAHCRRGAYSLRLGDGADHC